MLLPPLFAVFFLIAVNAFFSATEFSFVAVRLSRVHQLVEEGRSGARVLQELLGDMGRVVSGVQVGITLTSLALGYIGEVTLANVFDGWFYWLPGRSSGLAAHSLAFGCAFALLTILQVVLGELVPKTISLARAERVALLVARPFGWFLHAFSWAIDALDGIARVLVRAMGVRSPQAHSLVGSAEELQALVAQARDQGLLQASEHNFIERALDLRHVRVKEIIVPRPDVHALPVDASLEESLRLFTATQRSRLPVYEGNMDHILGFVHVKDLMWALAERARRAESGQQSSDFHLRPLLREVLIVPETKAATELLVEFRTRHAGMAMVVDEFGSILGLVTLEDILEEMVGEIHDEFDVVKRPQTLPDGSLIFDASLPVRDLETQFGISMPDDPGYETIGGFVMSRLGFIPRGGESFEAEGYRFTVHRMDHRRVSRVLISQLNKAETGANSQISASGIARPSANSGPRQSPEKPSRK
jgi:putative hemolysin